MIVWTSQRRFAALTKIPARKITKEVNKSTFKIIIRRDNRPVLPYDKSSAQLIDQASKIVLIRHGNSLFNKLFHELEGPGYVVTPKYFDIYSDLSIIDSPLSPLGIKQWIKASKLAKLVDVDYVFVSPLRRAMETAYHMFRDHPNFQNIVFYIHPLIRENIMTSADIPEDITVNLDTYGALFPRLNLEYFPRTVSDELDNLYYARNFLPHLAERVSGLNKKKTDEVICTEIRERFPKSIEAFHFTKSRVEQMKAFFKEFIKDKSAEKKKIAIVGHSYFFKLWTGLWYDETLKLRKQPNEYIWLENWELFPDVFNFPYQIQDVEAIKNN